MIRVRKFTSRVAAYAGVVAAKPIFGPAEADPTRADDELHPDLVTGFSTTVARNHNWAQILPSYAPPNHKLRLSGDSGVYQHGSHICFWQELQDEVLVCVLEVDNMGQLIEGSELEGDEAHLWRVVREDRHPEGGQYSPIRLLVWNLLTQP